MSSMSSSGGYGAMDSGSSSLGSITLKIILSREEVEYLFGFDGTLINQLRSQSGANINLTDGDSYERVLMINGSLELIFKAFSLITRKLWDFVSSLKGPQNLVIRLAVPASQCGSIIGKQGIKVKEIRDLTGANIQVSQESLGDSTERCVEISGSGEACLQCAYHVGTVLEETPLRGEIIPYVPSSLRRSDWTPLFLCGDKAYVIQEDVAVLASPELLQKELAKTLLGQVGADAAAYPKGSGPNPLALLAAVNGRNHKDPIRRDMTVEADLLGFIIGKGGSKIAEIRRMSGATIMVNEEDMGGPSRAISLSGPQESVLLAEFLIQTTLDGALKERTEYNNSYNNNMMDPPLASSNYNHNNTKDMSAPPSYTNHQQGHNQGPQHYPDEDPRTATTHHRGGSNKGPYNQRNYHQQQQQHNGNHHNQNNPGNYNSNNITSGTHSNTNVNSVVGGVNQHHTRGMSNPGRQNHRERMGRRSPGEGRPHRGRRGRR